MFGSIKSSLHFWFIALAIVPLIIISLVIYQNLASTQLENLQNQIVAESKEQRAFIDNWFDYRFKDVTKLANESSSKHLLTSLIKIRDENNLTTSSFVETALWRDVSNQYKSDLTSMMDIYEYIYDILLVDPNGNIIFSVLEEPDLGTNLFTGVLKFTNLSSNLKKAYAEQKIVFSDIERYAASREDLTGFLIAPVYDDSKAITGSLVIQINLNRVFDLLRLNQTDQKSSYIVDQRGVLKSPIGEDNSEVLQKKMDIPLFDPKSKAPTLANDSDTIVKYSKRNGDKFLININILKVGDVVWYLVNEISEKQAYSVYNVIQKNIMMVILLSLILVSLIGYLITKKITHPIISLATTAHSIAENNSDGKLEIIGKNEVSQLAEAFNQVLIAKKVHEHAAEEGHQITKSALAEADMIRFAMDQHSIVSVTNVKGEITLINDKFCEISGYSKDELMGNNHRIVNSGSHSTGFFKEMYRIIASGKVWHGEICNRAKNGHLYWVHSTIVPILNADKKPESYIAIRTDISERKRSELAEKANRERLELVFESTGVGIWEWSEKTNLIEVNESWANIAGFHENSFQILNFESWCHMIHPDDLEKFNTSLFNHLKDNSINYECEIRIRHKNGHWLWVLSSGRAVDRNENGYVTRMIGTLLDIDKLKRNEILLVAAKDSAEVANRSKSDFLASMSHEIRTPLNGVIGMLSLLEKSNLSHDQIHKLVLAKSSADSLLTLINDILDFSKIEADKLEIESINFNLYEMLSQTTEALAIRAHSKGVDLILDDTEVEHTMVKSDPGRIRQVINNLVGNAIKFTEYGEIAIKVKTVPSSGTKVKLICTITDTGIGIPQDKLNSLFDRFTQVDTSTTRKYGGTGLGLAITKKLCRIMNGDVQVSSVVGVGSSFEFQIMLEEGYRQSKESTLASLKKVNILIVDDSQKSAEVLQKHLQKLGANCNFVTSAQKAIAIMEQNHSVDESFDFALVDMYMPSIDGIELCKKIRSDKRFANTKIILMSPITESGLAEKIKNSGFAAYTTKPVVLPNLIKIIDTLVNKEFDASAEMLTTANLLRESKNIKGNNWRWPENSRILLVEDNHVNQEVAIGILDEFNISCGIAGNGIEALNELKSAPRDEPYTLVFMDCQMPDMDGYEATQLIRQGNAGKSYIDVPIIAMTANAMRGDREKCLNAGMSDYLTKPIEPGAILSVLTKYLNDNQTASSETHIQTNDDNEVGFGIDEDIWDIDGTLRRILGKEKLLVTLIHSFLKEMPKRFKELESAEETNDHKSISLVAHTIKGVAANLGALKLQATAKTLEEETKEKNTKNYSELIVTLNNDFSTVKKLLEQYISEKEEVESPKEVNTVVLAKASKKKLSSMGNKIMEFKDRVSAHEYLTTEDVEELNQSCPIDELQQEFEELSAFIENLDFDLADKKVDDILAIIKHGNKSGSVKKRKVGS